MVIWQRMFFSFRLAGTHEDILLTIRMASLSMIDSFATSLLSESIFTPVTWPLASITHFTSLVVLFVTFTLVADSLA